MSQRLTVVLLLVLAATIPVSARADEPQVEGNDHGGVTIIHTEPGSDGSPGVDQHSSGGPTVYSFHTLDWGPNGGLCLGTHYTTDRSLADIYDRGEEIRHRLGEPDPPPCPPHTGPAPAGPTPGTRAREFWDVRILPAPTLKVVPDYGIVGKKVYLQIGGEPAKKFTVDDPLGPPITIAATSRYVVDWGDGTITQTTSQGGPYPNGDVTHVYGDQADSVTVRVQQKWSATWSAGGPPAALDPLQTAGALTFRVVQVQAVRNG